MSVTFCKIQKIQKIIIEKKKKIDSLRTIKALKEKK